MTYAVIGLDRLGLAFEGSGPLVVRGWVVKCSLCIRYIGDLSITHMDLDGRLGDFHSSLKLLACEARKVLRCHGLGGLVRLRAELPLVGLAFKGRLTGELTPITSLVLAHCFEHLA